MNCVVDSSVAFKWEVAEADRDKALRLRDDYRTGGIDLIAPDVFTAELAHALTRAERQGRIPIGQALTLWSDAMILPPRLVPSTSLTSRAIEISSQLRIGVYDSLYV